MSLVAREPDIIKNRAPCYQKQNSAWALVMMGQLLQPHLKDAGILIQFLWVSDSVYESFC